MPSNDSRKKILIYTDSRGQHTPRGEPVHDVFAQRLAQRPDVDAEVVLCPMKWTTTLDFLDFMEGKDQSNYDHIILYTGIVDWSPRPQKSALNDLYNNPNVANLDNTDLNTRDYSKKIVNNKKDLFDKVFGADAIEAYLRTPFDVEYEGQPTINMYGLEMAKKNLLPRLAAIENLIFVNSNRFIPGWEGDFTRGRPQNIKITEEYSELFRDQLRDEKVIDLLAWNEPDIKRYTCDNLHLTKEGSDYIYEALCERMGLESSAPKTDDKICPGEAARRKKASENNALISIIVPIFNVEAYLRECLESIAAQDDKNFEAVLIDDGSTDASSAIAQEYAERLKNFRYFRQDNQGLGGARNRGMIYARGEFITFVDSDDYIAEDYVSALRREQQAGDHDVVTTYFSKVTEEGQFIRSQPRVETSDAVDSLTSWYAFQVLGIFQPSIACARLYRASIINGNEIRFPSRLAHEDVFFTYKVLLLSQTVGFIDKDLYFYRERDDALSQTIKHSHVDALIFQWYDSKRFLEALGKSEEGLKFAARKTLYFLGGLIQKSRKNAPEILAYLTEQIAARRDEFVRISEIALKSDLPADSYPKSPIAFIKDEKQQSDPILRVKYATGLTPHQSKEGGLSLNAGEEKISALKDVYAGERCFIIGNGPSLNKAELALLANEYTFGVNSFYYLTRETGFRPTFFTVEDNLVMKENLEEIKNYNAPIKFFPYDYKELHPETDEVFYFNMDQGFYLSNHPYYCKPRFSKDAANVVYCGQTVTYINLQLAFYLGFSEATLIGMDFNYVLPPEHKVNGNHILSTTDDPNHFHKDYFGKGKTWKDPKLDRVALNYKMAKQAYESEGREIRNATIGGKLDIFERVNYSSLFAGGQKTRGKSVDSTVFTPSTSPTNKEGYFAPFGRPVAPSRKLTENEKQDYRSKAGLGEEEKFASLIIGVKFSNEDEERVRNLSYLLNHLEDHYGDFFEILLVEQDTHSRLESLCLNLPSFARHELIYNPSAYNRGWGYNVSAKHLTDLPVIVLMDTDVLPGANFVDEILKCHLGVKAISPYSNVYFSTEKEADEIIQNGGYSHLTNPKCVSKPTTITGGVLIARRDAFLEVQGFEQYTEYGGEDRSLDVILLNKFDSSEVQMAPYTYVHLYHTNPPTRPRISEVLNHLKANYGCLVNLKLPPDADIHSECVHVGSAQIKNNIKAKASTFADLDLYRSGRTLSVNGTYMNTKQNTVVMRTPKHGAKTTTSPYSTVTSIDPIYPPEFSNLNDYAGRELYNTGAPDREKLASLYNAFKGERCFIIGNGPSLNEHDLSLLKNEYTFAVNSFYYKTDETGFKPTFFVVEDTSVMRENIERIKAYDTEYKFFPTLYRSLHPEADNVYFFEMNRGFYEKSSPNYCVPRFSTDASNILYCGQSVTYINLQLAFFMGFSEVHLIGMDFNYVIPKEHKRKGDMIYSTTDDPNHFHKDYFGKGKSWKDPKLDRVEMNYRQAKLAYEAVGRKIFNATKGGKLEIFDRIDYDALFQSKADLTTKIKPASDGFSNAPYAGAPGNAPVRLASPRANQPGNSERHAQAPFYASYGERLKQKSPRLFLLLQFMRRALAGIWRRKTMTVPALGLALALVIAAALTNDPLIRISLLFSGVSALLFFILFYVALRSYIALQGIRGESADRSAALAATLNTKLQRIDSRLTDTQKYAQHIDKKVKDTRNFSQRIVNQQKIEIEKLQRRNNEAIVRIETSLSETRKGLTAVSNIKKGLTAVRNEVLAATKTQTTRAEEQQKQTELITARVASAERQIGKLRYTNTPRVFVFFGHHKCASRFFRGVVFPQLASMTDAATRQYKVKNPPFHYSRGEDLDLYNIDFENLGAESKEIVLFGNASERSLERIKKSTDDWKGLRVLRDPRQVLVSNYFHHKGNHHTELNGWVYDKLVNDKPILRELPEEEGLLYELDNISKDIIENQVLATFDDERVITYKIEDFSKDPKKRLLELSEFFHVADLAGLDLEKKFANPNSGDWRNHFTTKLRDVFKERYGEALIELGYEENMDW